MLKARLAGYLLVPTLNVCIFIWYWNNPTLTVMQVIHAWIYYILSAFAIAFSCVLYVGYASQFGECECGKTAKKKYKDSLVANCPDYPKCMPMDDKVRRIKQERQLGISLETCRIDYGEDAVEEFLKGKDNG
jgi:hypothetical protein